MEDAGGDEPADHAGDGRGRWIEARVEPAQERIVPFPVPEQEALAAANASEPEPAADAIPSEDAMKAAMGGGDAAE